MTGNKIFYVGIAVLVLGIGIAIGTYAYYRTTITGNANATVLAWDCSLGSSGVQKNTFANMYPGSYGTIVFNIKSSMPADYTINIGSYTNMTTGTIHSNLKLYKTSSGATSYSNQIAANSVAATGTTTGSGTNYTGASTIYYYWPYGTASETYSNSVPSFTYSIDCQQKNA